jgi:hypothetical protein
MRAPHTVSVSREVDDVDDNLRKVRGLEVVHAALRGLVEPRRSQESSTQIGQLSQEGWLLTWWDGSELRAGDQVTWQSKTFVVEGLIDDRHRPGGRVAAYQVCHLVQKP